MKKRFDSMRECLLCEKDMKKSKNLFGSGCINHIYTYLDLEKQIRNKENYLCKQIMKETKVKNINNNQKQILIERYLTLNFLEKIKYGDFEKIKKEIDKDIKNIKRIESKKQMCSINDIRLKEAYDLYKKQIKFENKIKELKNYKSISDIEKLLASFSFIFNLYRYKNQYLKNAFKAMQFMFWQTVIEVGRTGFDYKISAMLLQHSLEKNPKDLTFTNGIIVDTIKNDTDFKMIIRNAIKEQDRDDTSFSITKKAVFNNNDLYYSIHGATITIKGDKVNDKWNLKILVEDKYDYTDFKEFSDYYNDGGTLKRSLFSSTIYNLAYFSVKFKVIKPYHIKVDFEINNYEINI